MHACSHPGTAATRPAPSGRSSHLKRGLIAFALTLCAGPALADPRFEGHFQGRGEGRLGLQVFTMDGSDILGTESSYFVNADTAIPNECSGDLRGLAREIAPRTLRLSKPKESDETCVLTLRYSPDYSRVAMSAEQCGYFHGASCDFDGNLRRR